MYICGMDFGADTEDVRKRIRRDVSCRRLWVFSGERAAAQEDEGRRSPNEPQSIDRKADYATMVN